MKPATSAGSAQRAEAAIKVFPLLLIESQRGPPIKYSTHQKDVLEKPKEYLKTCNKTYQKQRAPHDVYKHT